MDPPARIAVGLISSPGDTAPVLTIGFTARLEYRFAELKVVVQNGLIENLRKRVGCVVVHRPASAHHGADADFDQLAGDAVSEPIIGDGPSIHFSEMTAIEKNQIRDDF